MIATCCTNQVLLTLYLAMLSVACIHNPTGVHTPDGERPLAADSCSGSSCAALALYTTRAASVIRPAAITINQSFFDSPDSLCEHTQGRSRQFSFSILAWGKDMMFPGLSRRFLVDEHG